MQDLCHVQALCQTKGSDMYAEARTLGGMRFTFRDAPPEFERGCTVEVGGVIESFSCRSEAYLWALCMARAAERVSP